METHERSVVMADWFYGRIRIGGRLPRKDLPEFMKTISSEISEGKTEEELRGYIVDAGCLELDDPQARYGRFDGIEEYCRQHGLTYVRDSDSYGECDAEKVFWRPGMESAECLLTNKNEHIVIEKRNLLTYINDLKKFLEKVKSVDDAPLKINSKNPHVEAYAKHILATNEINPLDLLTLRINMEYPDVGEIPAFEII
jgi:hypothetical protein